MAIFSGERSHAINSPRHLTLRHVRESAKKHSSNSLRVFATANSTTSKSPEDDTDLQPGEVKLNSYWAPALEAGVTHKIRVTQTIKADVKKDVQTLNLESEQEFNVEAPQFSLPDGSVHSVYPPAGYSDDHRILPHVVLTDPHLPWERYGTMSDTGPRGRVPWLALLSFTHDELVIAPAHLDKSTGKMFTDAPTVPDHVVQSTTMAVNLAIGDLWKVEEKKMVTSPIRPSPGNDKMKDARGDFIFIKPDVFTSFFSTFDETGVRRVPATPSTSQYQFLSHVRKVNSSGMALAGVEKSAVFSIIIANRAGPIDNPTPTTATVHLVSIEGVESMKFPIQTPYVALCTLYSWNYTVMPPGMLNPGDGFEHIGKGLDVLGPPSSLIPKATDDDKVLSARVSGRLRDGYSLVKYRTQTGETTAALFRGPLTPTLVSKHDNFSKCSNSGVDLQIMDTEIGIMDVSYSMAWQIGRCMALGDQVFTAALMRMRTSIHGPATRNAKFEVMKARNENAIRSRSEVLGGLPSLISNLSAIHDLSTTPDGGLEGSPGSGVMFEAGDRLARWSRARLTDDDIPSLSLNSPEMQKWYAITSVQAARDQAKSSEGNIYDETNHPVSTDWMIILAWLMDRVFLTGLPAHYLITDPSHLGPESLRFFHIDPNWIDALIDGALSLGNHMGLDYDRLAIKTAFEDFLAHKPDHSTHTPQIPRYGFYLRSDLVTMFPDLQVTINTESEDSLKASGTPLLRHEIVSDGIMLGLFDRVPGSENFRSLIFTQPPHQQRYSVAAELDSQGAKVDILRQYTVPMQIPLAHKEPHDPLKVITLNRVDKNNLFVWGTSDDPDDPHFNDLRFLRLPYYAQRQQEILQSEMPMYQDGTVKKRYFHDPKANSALFGMQLADPKYQLQINFTEPAVMNVLARLRPDPSLALTASSSASAVRTLSMLELPHHLKLGPHSRQTLENGQERADTPVFTTNQLPVAPLEIELLRDFAPHHRIPTIELTTPPKDTSGLSIEETSTSPSPIAARVLAFAGPATTPTYRIIVRTKTSDVVKLEPNGLRQDLIFSITLGNKVNSQYKLRELDIRIRLSGGIDNSPLCLMKSYDYASPSMLRNLRFNVLAANATIDEVPYLQLRVLPRSANRWIYVSRVTDMSFVLPLVQLNDLPNDTQLFLPVFSSYHEDPKSPRPEDDVCVTVIRD
ncbi:hypothetical protein GGR57DRAFT_511261 [Xylariaceae sp. FL1272]|nr:hypothetical protein GGR57DRAFT_511261 [Xylariaceae sp. FL1272]